YNARNTMAIVGQDARSTFSALHLERKALIIAQWAHDVTVAARDGYPGATTVAGSIESLAAFNEVQHTMSSQLAHMLRRDEARYPDDAFIDIVLSKARRAGCEAAVLQAFQRAVSQK